MCHICCSLSVRTFSLINLGFVTRDFRFPLIVVGVFYAGTLLDRMSKPKRNHEALYAAARIECSQQRKEKRVKTGATIDDALLCAIGNERDGSGIPVPPLLSIIAGYLKPFVWSLHWVPFSSASSSQLYDLGPRVQAFSWHADGFDCIKFVFGEMPSPVHAASEVSRNSIGLQAIGHCKTNTCSTVTIAKWALNRARRPGSLLFTSDGQTMWCTTLESELLVRGEIGSKLTIAVDCQPGKGVQLSWNRGPNIKPDSQLLIVTASGQLRRYDIASKKMHTLIESGVRSAACAETGHIFIASDSDQSVKVFDPNTSALTVLFVCETRVVSLILIDDYRRLLGVAENEVWSAEAAPEFFVFSPLQS